MFPARLSRSLALLSLLALGACANSLALKTGGGTDFDPPPLSEGMARVYFYRDTLPDESTVSVTISIDHREVGPAIPGGSSYVDIRPGTHVIGASAASNGPDSERRFRLQAGQSGYVAIQVQQVDAASSTMGMATGYGPQLIFPYGNNGLQALRRLRFYGAAKVE